MPTFSIIHNKLLSDNWTEIGLCELTFTVSDQAVTADISYFGAILLKKITRLYAMKDRGQKSKILPFATLFGDSYFAAYRVHRGKPCRN